MNADRLTLRAGLLSAEVVPGTGAEIRSIKHQRLGEVLWDCDVEPIRTLRLGFEASAPSTDPASRWLNDYNGGWQILFPNAGSAARVGGVNYKYHGAASRVPWKILHSADGQASLESWPVPHFCVRRTIVLDPSNDAVSLSTSITNTSDSRQPFLWFEHPAFPLTADTEISLTGGRTEAPVGIHAGSKGPPAPGETHWPWIPGAAGPVNVSRSPRVGVEQLFVVATIDPCASLLWPSLGRQITLRWDGELFPYLWIWMQNRVQRYPFFGRTSCVTLEPATSPTMAGLRAATVHGFAQYLEPSATRATRVDLLIEASRPGVSCRASGKTGPVHSRV